MERQNKKIMKFHQKSKHFCTNLCLIQSLQLQDALFNSLILKYDDKPELKTHNYVCTHEWSETIAWKPKTDS